MLDIPGAQSKFSHCCPAHSGFSVDVYKLVLPEECKHGQVPADLQKRKQKPNTVMAEHGTEAWQKMLHLF